MKLEILSEWDGKPLEKCAVIDVDLEPRESELQLSVSAPFYNDPPAPQGKVGEPCKGLWDFEGRDVPFALYSSRCFVSRGVLLSKHGVETILGGRIMSVSNLKMTQL